MLSLDLETKIFCLKATDRYGILGSKQHSLWAYATFRAEQTQSFCMGFSASPKEQLKSILSTKVTVLYAVTPLLQLLCGYALRVGTEVSSVEKIIVGGAYWPASLTESCIKVFPRAEIFCFYGATELGYVAYARPPRPLCPFPSVEVRGDDQDQLWVRSPLTIRPDHWLASGDRIAWVDPDAADKSRLGFSILGRVDRVINQSGVKIQPEPIEEAVSLALDSSELALVGLPDPLRGERMTLLLGPDLQYRHIEVKNALHDLAGLMTPGLKGVRLLQLKGWPTRSNGKLNLKGLLEEIPRGRPVPRAALGNE